MTSQIYFRFPVCWRHLFKEVKIYLQIKFWLDITTFASENKWQPYSNSTSGFDFDRFIIIGISFCVWLPIFTRFRPGGAAELCRHVDFSRWRPQPSQIYFRFQIWRLHSFTQVDLYLQTKFRRHASKYSRHNLLLQLSENKRSPYLNSTSGFDCDLFIAIGMSFCTWWRDLICSEQRDWSWTCGYFI